MTVDNAVILAAGRSQHFAPFTYEIPKGLFRVHGEVLVERQIKQLKEAGVNEIYIVVGYMKEKFFYLEEKYGVNIVLNGSFENKGNINSLYSVKDVLKNTYICCADHYFINNPFLEEPVHSYRAVTHKEGKFREFAVKVSDVDVITDFKVGGNDSLCMVGQAFVTEAFSKKLVEHMEREINDFGVAHMFWEEFYAKHSEDLTLFAKYYKNEDILEFDSIRDLLSFDQDFLVNLDSRIMQNICTVLKCEPKEILNIEIIQKGLTNVSFKFDVKGNTYVYRHPGGTSGNLVSRESEVFAQMQAKKLGIDKSVIYISVDGWKISHFVDNTVEVDLDNNDEQLAKVMEGLRILHSAKFEDCQEEFNNCKEVEPVEEAKRLMRIASRTKGDLIADFSDIIKPAEKLFEYVKNDGLTNRVLTHGDIYPPNFLFTESGDMYMIDWEYTRVADSANDLAGFIARYIMSEEQIDRYLKAYFNRDLTFEEYRHYIGYAGCTALYWMTWGLYKGSVNEDDGFFMFDSYKLCKNLVKKALPMYENEEK